MKGRVCFHIDLDAFFAAVEQLDHPELRGLPVIVGARPGGRGVVSTCSYEARAFGVHSAMPIGEAVRRCPEGIFLPVRMERYGELSVEVMSIIADFSPDMRRISIDEAALDMTGTEGLWGPPEAAARRLKDRVVTETGLTVSVGVAPNPYVAKIASGVRKPDGLVVIQPGEEAAFMRGLPLEKLWGAGEKTQARFAEAGIVSMADLIALSEKSLAGLFGPAGGRFLYMAARGQDPGIAIGEAESRSMSMETTFERDLVDRESLHSVLFEMVDALRYRLWAEGLRSRTLVLKLRLFDFSTSTRRVTRPDPFREAEEVFREAAALLARTWDGRTPVRLIGLGFAELESLDIPAQGELFEAGCARRRRVEQTVFEIERRGLGELRRARLVKDGPGRRRRGGGWPGSGSPHGSEPSP